MQVKHNEFAPPYSPTFGDIQRNKFWGDWRNAQLNFSLGPEISRDQIMINLFPN